jgi:hypothetical protein
MPHTSESITVCELLTGLRKYFREGSVVIQRHAFISTIVIVNRKNNSLAKILSQLHQIPSPVPAQVCAKQARIKISIPAREANCYKAGFPTLGHKSASTR